MENLTPMMKQYYDIKKQYQDYILMYRLGDFYEMFFNDAIEASELLEITLTKRNAGNNQTAPLCGVPYHAVEGYIAKLLLKGRKVAICEQVEDPATAKGLVKREVVRVITPGTLVEPSMLDDQSNNFLVSIALQDEQYVLAYTDITNGDIHTKTFPYEEKERIIDTLIQLSASECLYYQDSICHFIQTSHSLSHMVLTALPTAAFSYSSNKEKMLRHYKVHSLDALGLSEQTLTVVVVGALLGYIIDTQKVDLDHFNKIIRDSDTQMMVLDKYTRSNLELTATIRNKDKKGSLLWVLDHTSTSMGARLLKRWIEEPLLDLDRIEKRLDTVEVFFNEKIIREELKNSLKSIYDLERLTSKIIYGSANARDLVALKTTLLALPAIKQLLKALEPVGNIISLYDEIILHEELCTLLTNALIEEPPFTIREGGLFKENYTEELHALRHIEQEGKSWLLAVENEEKEKTGIKNLKIGFNKVFGYFIEVSKGNVKLVPDYYIRKQTLANAERYITEPLKIYEEKLLGAEEKMQKLEYQLFLNLVDLIKGHVQTLKQTAQALAQVDVLLSFGTISEKNHYTKPCYNSTGAISIVNGRHPVVEALGAGQGFVANDAHLDMEENRLFIITGPNMAGKSTFLRQIALISLLGQIGCFVPADQAELCILDRIFTRVGASDDLTQGQSTFMVEMSELSHILRYATSKSLLILDEIGRGTSTYDGLSIAWSVVEYLSSGSEIKPKTLFATHYHELTELEGRLKGVQNYFIAVEELKEDILFLRKIKKGGVNKSFGIQVAQLAGLPKKVILRAKEILVNLEAHDINKPSISVAEDLMQDNQSIPSGQLSFFSDEESEILKELKNIDINSMTPMYSMNKLFDWVQRVGKRKG